MNISNTIQKVKILIEMGFVISNENSRLVILHNEGLDQIIQIRKDEGKVVWVNNNQVHESRESRSGPVGREVVKENEAERSLQKFEGYKSENDCFNFPRRL